MCGLGMGELLVILLIVALLFGASRLPQLGKALGETVRNFKQATDDGKAAKPEPLDVHEVGHLAEAKSDKPKPGKDEPKA